MKETLVDEGMISKEDLNLISIVDDPQEVLKIIDNFYEDFMLKPNF